jgi:hypothetical protein
VDHLLRPITAAAPPSFWRSAAVVASLVAVVELVLLVVTGTALLSRNGSSTPARREAAATPAVRTHPKPTSHRTRGVAAAKLARGKVGVMVLNGNGRQGAAAAAAARVRRHGYRIRSIGNAGRMTYARSLVMYRTGYEGEGRRLAHDLGIRVVAPLDGMRPAQLHGAQAVVVVGP